MKPKAIRDPSDAADQRSRIELVMELRALRERLDRFATLETPQHDLSSHQEERAVQAEELRRFRDELDASRQRFRDLFDFAPIAIVTHDPGGLIQDLNLQATLLLDCDREHVIGIPLVNHVAPEDRRFLLNHLSRARRQAEATSTELRIRLRSGRVVPVHVMTRRSTANASGPYMTAIVDLTERKRHEEERRRVDEERHRTEEEHQAAQVASEATDHFLAVLSHELRTPLTPVVIALETAIRRGIVPDELLPTFEIMRRNVLLETRLIDDLLDITRIRQGKLRLEPAYVDLHEVVYDVVSTCAPSTDAARLSVATELRASRSWLYADPLRLRQVCWNLVQNAMRNTPAGGRILVRTENDGTRAIVLTVSDTGRGITPERLARLFKPFDQDTGARIGLGLGLSISRGLVEGHGGRIQARSAGLGKGATFTVELPVVDAPAVRARSPEARPLVDRVLSVLLVEDNEDNASALVDLLELQGFRVERAPGVAAALRCTDRDYDVLVSDLGLPDGSGIDVVQAFSARRPVKAIALSGYGSDSDVERSLAAGFSLHLTKPVEPTELVRAIEELAAQDGGADSSAAP
jgi:PAS domain S-box-containing protein